MARDRNAAPHGSAIWAQREAAARLTGSREPFPLAAEPPTPAHERLRRPPERSKKLHLLSKGLLERLKVAREEQTAASEEQTIDRMEHLVGRIGRWCRLRRASR
ncbi:MAG: hypothetical protein AAGH71_01110 [Planctomycetota bacterium]